MYLVLGTATLAMLPPDMKHQLIVVPSIAAVSPIQLTSALTRFALGLSRSGDSGFGDTATRCDAPSTRDTLSVTVSPLIQCTKAFMCLATVTVASEMLPPVVERLLGRLRLQRSVYYTVNNGNRFVLLWGQWYLVLPRAESPTTSDILIVARIQ